MQVTQSNRYHCSKLALISIVPHQAQAHLSPRIVVNAAQDRGLIMKDQLLSISSADLEAGPESTIEVVDMWRFAVDFSIFEAHDVRLLRAVLDASRRALTYRALRLLPSPLVIVLYTFFSL